VVFVVTLLIRNRDRLLVGALAPPAQRCGPLLNAAWSRRGFLGGCASLAGLHGGSCGASV